MSKIRRYILDYHLYFVTTTFIDRVPWFKDPNKALLFSDIINKYRKQYEFQIFGYVIMPDHFHGLIMPGFQINISRIMQDIKRYFSKLVNEEKGTNGSLWQRRFYDRVVRDEEEYIKILEYIHYNPVKAGLTATPEDYLYSSYRFYNFGEAGPVQMDNPRELL